MRLKTEHEQRVNIENMNQQKINFFTYISHDLKTPLTLILSPLQRLIQQPQISNNDKEKLEVIYRNANRMNYLINELLTFSKIEMKQMRISVRKGDIMHFLEELSHIFDIVAGEREIDFIVNLEDTEEEVWFSPSKLERILYNLLSNAFKYTQPGGYVKLSAKLIKEEKGTFVQISVKDNGRGIPKEAQEQIFESYYQVEKRDHREGFGLGLSLTRSLIHMHKGEIRVESEINKGSDFIVTLNVSEDAYNPDERSSENITTEEIQKYNQRIKETIELIPEKLTNKEKDPARESIMIVEDNKEMNDYLASIFSEKYDIIRAYNGAGSLQEDSQTAAQPHYIGFNDAGDGRPGIHGTCQTGRNDQPYPRYPPDCKDLMRTTIRKVICGEPMRISLNLSTPRIWNCWYRISKRAGNRVLNTSNRQKN